MQSDIEALNRVIRGRRSVFPEMYNTDPISRETLLHIVENGTWAPTHQLTQPWRFRIIEGAGCTELANQLAQAYKNNTPESSFSEATFNKLSKRPALCTAVIAICMQRDPQERVPEWEELAAVSCAVQNMWLTCTALQIGCYWASPKPKQWIGDWLQLEAGEQCLGFLFMGRYDTPKPESRHNDVLTKIQFIS